MVCGSHVALLSATNINLIAIDNHTYCGGSSVGGCNLLYHHHWSGSNSSGGGSSSVGGSSSGSDCSYC